MTHDGSSVTEELVQRAGRGDLGAQAELLERYRARLRRMVAIRLDKRLAARTDPSDVVQETLHVAHRRMPEYFADPRVPFYPWLRRIAADRLADVYRQHVGAEKRSVLREHAWMPELNDDSVAELTNSIVTNSESPSERAIEGERQFRVRAALLELKPADREILALRYLEQLEVPEIAVVLEISPTAVTSRHLRALQRLRRLMGNEHGNS
jgi:RNA polymerase sigma-70 factor (ECF subfamily)